MHTIGHGYQFWELLADDVEWLPEKLVQTNERKNQIQLMDLLNNTKTNKKIRPSSLGQKVIHQRWNISIVAVEIVADRTGILSLAKLTR